MHAVITTGGKQYKVAEGEQIDVEKLGAVGDALTFTPILLIDGDRVLAGSSELSGASVQATVVGAATGPKVTGFRYKNKSNQRKRWGHRQHYSTIEITAIEG